MRMLLYASALTFLIGCERISIKQPAKKFGFDVIQRQISALTDSLLSARDSCIVANYIRDPSILEPGRYVVINNETAISHFTCPDNNFSFAVLTDINSGAQYAFPLSDIYILRHWQTATDSMKLIQIDSNVPRLGELWRVGTLQGDREISFFLERMIGEIYVEKVENKYIPILSRIYLDELDDLVPADITEKLKVFPDNTIMLLDKYFGLIIFKWRIDNNVIDISEYVIPFRKYRSYGLDVPTLYSEECAN